VLFYEYFHGDTGRGVGASHQTGWTGLVAKLLQPRGKEASAPREVEVAAEKDVFICTCRYTSPGSSWPCSKPTRWPAWDSP
jgi:hypothetical protein